MQENSFGSSTVDFLGGMGAFLSLVLLQSAFLWHSFGTGMNFTKLEIEGEQLFSREAFPSGATERSIATLYFLGFAFNTCQCYLISVWRAELLGSIDNRWKTTPTQGVAELNQNPSGESFKEKFSFLNTINHSSVGPAETGVATEDEFENYQGDGQENLAKAVF